MRAARWGRIVNLSSVAAQTGGVVGPHYAASKAGILGLTHSYANLLAKEGITVNAIAPALIETEMVRCNPNARPDLIPVGRFGTVDEVADVAVMLARNGYVTGQTINVNGGWYHELKWNRDEPAMSEADDLTFDRRIAASQAAMEDSGPRPVGRVGGSVPFGGQPCRMWSRTARATCRCPTATSAAEM